MHGPRDSPTLHSLPGPALHSQTRSLHGVELLAYGQHLHSLALLLGRAFGARV